MPTVLDERLVELAQTVYHWRRECGLYNKRLFFLIIEIPSNSSTGERSDYHHFMDFLLVAAYRRVVVGALLFLGGCDVGCHTRTFRQCGEHKIEAL